MIHDAETLIQTEEGRKNSAYLDTEGLWTNGIGHKYGDGQSHAGEFWDDAKVDAVFAVDFAHARDGIAVHWPAIRSLDEVRQAYVVSMAFQMGVSGVLGWPHTLAYLAAGDWPNAAAGVRSSKWYSQTSTRAERCARAFETGQWQQVA